MFVYGVFWGAYVRSRKGDEIMWCICQNSLRVRLQSHFCVNANVLLAQTVCPLSHQCLSRGLHFFRPRSKKRWNVHNVAVFSFWAKYGVGGWLKLQDWTLTDDFAGVDKVGVENEGLDIAGLDNSGPDLDGRIWAIDCNQLKIRAALATMRPMRPHRAAKFLTVIFSVFFSDVVNRPIGYDLWVYYVNFQSSFLFA